MRFVYLLLIAFFFTADSFGIIGPITGSRTLCVGSTSVLSDTSAGGTWSSSNGTIATVGSFTGTVSGITPGVVTITYVKGSSSVSAQLTVNPTPSLDGPDKVCMGQYAFFSSPTPGGSFSSGDTTVAEILEDSGYFTPLLPGVTTVAYILPTGCYTTKIVTVAPLVTPIVSGASTICVRDTIAFTSTPIGGTWTSHDPAIISINPVSGIAVGISTGTQQITYTSPAGCYQTVTMLVNPSPFPILGPSSICVGLPTEYAGSYPGGRWESNNPAVIHDTLVDFWYGNLVGFSSGTATVTYTISDGCHATITITVNSSPGQIFGQTSVCRGDSTNLYDTTIGGRWSVSDSSVAAVNFSSGGVRAYRSGVDTVHYTKTNGCSVSSVLYVPSTVAGPSFVCQGNTILLSDSLAGGTWLSSDTSVAKVDLSSGVVTGVAPGLAAVTYHVGMGCIPSKTINVTPATCSGTPSGGSASASATKVCDHTPVTLNLAGASVGCGFIYKWQSSTNGATFSDIPGAVSTTYAYTSSVTQYFRCKVSCLATGFFAYSTVVKVSVLDLISSHNVRNALDSACDAPDFYLSACHTTSGLNVTTWFGDGTWVNTPLTSTGTSHADVFHGYDRAGTYHVKQVLYLGTVPQDTISFSYEHLYCRTIPIKYYFDANSDCIFDEGDAPLLTPLSAEVDSNGIAVDTITATSGFYYKAMGPTGTVYSFHVLRNPAGFVASCPSGSIVYDTLKSPENGYIAKYVGFNCSGGTTTDFSIHVSTSTGRHTQQGTIVVDNTSCYPADAILRLDYSSKFTVLSSVPAPTSRTINSATWSLAGLSSLDSAHRTISYSLDRPLPWLPPGDTVRSRFIVSGIASGEIDTSNNVIVKVDTVRASYDPNEISVLPSGPVIPCTPLLYTIKFENTGNDTAHDITILDTLSDKLDLHSLDIAFASSAMNFALLKDGGFTVAKFDLPGINLLDSSAGEGSTGLLVFSIKTRQGLDDGILISNRAGIIFDDNPVVLTNTVSSVIGIAPITGPTLLCFPRPDTLSCNSENGIWSSSNTRGTVVSGVVSGLSSGPDTIIYTIANACGSRSVSKVLDLHPVVNPSVRIASSSGDTVCLGSDISFTSVVLDGGLAPIYRWTVNGFSAGTSSSYSYMPADGDWVAVHLTSNNVCAFPDTASSAKRITVETMLRPTVTVTTDVASVVFGEPVTFSAAVAGADTVIGYQWLVNWTYVAGATNSSYVTNAVVDNDSVSCIITTGNICGPVVACGSKKVSVSATGLPLQSNSANGLRILPNPNNGEFTITGKTISPEGVIAIVVTDMIGVEVYHKSVGVINGNICEKIVPDRRFARGVYIASVIENGCPRLLRFVVD